MRRSFSYFLTFSIISLLLASCGMNPSTGESGSPAPSPTIAPSETSTPEASNNTEEPNTPLEPADPLDERISRMSLDEKIGQMVMVGLDGTAMNANTRKMIEAYKVGGFILYRDNIKDASQTISLLNQLKETNKANGTALWLSVDQEGGKVDRLSSMFGKLPTARQVGDTNDDEYTRRVGQALGVELQSVGFNMDYAPVLDINSNPKNPVIGDRSFGAEADTVIRHGLEIMDGIRSQKIAAVVKHFPGHGDTSVDSHLDLPVVEKSLEELKQFELQPFAEAIHEDADAVMVGHLLLPKLDADNPASISRRIITDLLRKEMSYNGVVITDDMTMGGITKQHLIGEAAVQSIQAGSDIVLVGHDQKLQLEVLDALKESAKNGEITKERIDESVRRIISLKEHYELADRPVESIDTDAVNQQLKSLLEKK